MEILLSMLMQMDFSSGVYTVNTRHFGVLNFIYIISIFQL